jgi:hypothetical protein
MWPPLPSPVRVVSTTQSCWLQAVPTGKPSFTGSYSRPPSANVLGRCSGGSSSRTTSGPIRCAGRAPRPRSRTGASRHKDRRAAEYRATCRARWRFRVDRILHRLLLRLVNSGHRVGLLLDAVHRGLNGAGKRMASEGRAGLDAGAVLQEIASPRRCKTWVGLRADRCPGSGRRS